MQRNYLAYWIFFGSLLILFYSCTKKNHFPSGKVLLCDAETLTNDKKQFVATTDSSFLFSGGNKRTSFEAHGGTYSVYTYPGNEAFAFGLELKGLAPDSYFMLSVWRKSKDGKGTLVATAKNAKDYYQATSAYVEMDENGWERLELEVFIPPLDFENGNFSFYTWNNSSDTVFFDDLRIERISSKKYPEYNLSSLNILLDTNEYIKLYHKRKIAIGNGILQTGENDWVKAIVFSEGEMMKAKIRLKGDWLDHLLTDKWSLRIKTSKEDAWKRMRTFSIQSPKARDFLLEWYSHKFYETKDILTTRYGFIPVYFNNLNKGLFAYEEHFVKQLIESRNRREGPIVKFSENPFWQVQKMAIITSTSPELPYYETSVVDVFEESKTMSSPVLSRQFLAAQKLMLQYKKQMMPAEQIFDLKKLASYYAMHDMTHARHGMVWHNQRFYYNPLICKLEPIAFDGYTENSLLDLTINDNLAHIIINQGLIDQEQLLFYDLFKQPLFIKYYLSYLNEFSKERFVDSVTNVYNSEVLFYDSLLQMEFKYYHFDLSIYQKSAASIRAYLPTLENELTMFLAEKKPFNLARKVYTDTNTFENTPEFFVNAYMESHDGDSMVIGIHNYYPQEITLVGTGVKDKFIFNYFDSKPSIEAYTQGLDGVVRNLTVDSVSNFVFFTLKDNEDVFKIPIHRWPYPSGMTPQQELFQQIDLANNPFIERIVNHHIYIKKDSLVVDKPFLIPEGYTVHFEPGTVMNLVENAMFISYSPVIMQGTPDAPVVITSSDFTGNGFTVLQAEGRSHVEHTRFENLNTLNYKGWELTGAVNFYESDVDMIHSVVYRNQCEDGLNIIRSKFLTEDVTFDYTWGDAFDSDFSNGMVLNCKFTNLGNDAIDFSGSTITIQDVTIDKASDKGISGGELSHLTIKNTSIRRCNIGIASKDLSIVKVTGTRVLDCNYGLVLLQKKPEFGPGTLIFNQSTIQNPQTEMLIEVGSMVIKDGTEIPGSVKDASNLFY